MGKQTELFFETKVESNDISFYGAGHSECSGTAHIDWIVNLRVAEFGIVSIDSEIVSIAIEVEKESLEDSKSSELYVIGNGKGCEKMFDKRLHYLFEDDFTIVAEFESGNYLIEEIEVDFDRRRIELY